MNSTQNRFVKNLLVARQKQRNGTEGFTLVELMVVIVIVGIFSAVALPNFLSQTSKAKATECNTKAGAILSQVAAEHQLGSTEAAAMLTSEITTNNTNAEFCTFSDANLTAPLYGLDITGKTGSDLAGKYDANAWVQAETGKRDLTYKTGASPTAAAADCT